MRLQRQQAERAAVISYVRSLDSIPELDGQLKGKTRQKIAEFVATGSTRRYAAAANNPRVVTVDLFRRVWGIGTKTAQSLFDAGFRTICQLQASAAGHPGCKPFPVHLTRLVTGMALVGLRYFDDIGAKNPNNRIPRYHQ